MPNCITAVRAAAGGRKISDAKLAAIDERISAKMRDLARRDPQGWQGKSKDQRVTEAAQSAMKDIQAEAARKEMLGSLQVLRTQETSARLDDLQQRSGMNVTRSQAIARDAQNTDNYIHAIHNDAASQLGDLIDAASSTDGVGLGRSLLMRVFDVDNPQMTADVVREVFKNADGSTGNASAKAAAKAWLDTIEAMRVRFNEAGGDVGKLDYGYLSQSHNMDRVAAATPDKWAQKVLPLLDRRQYLQEDGQIMTNQQLLAMLERVHETLASGGMNKIEPGQFKGTGKRANAGSERRALHFKDGDAWMDYMREYGEGSLYDAMMGHVGAMSRNIGLVERYGPNPEQQFRFQADVAERADGRGTIASRAAGNTPQAYWDLISGRTTTPENPFISARFQDARNVQTAAKLGGAVITSLTDVGTVAATLNYNRLPYFAMLQNFRKQFSKEHRDFLQGHGIIAENLTNSLNRWTGDNMTNSLSGRVAGSVMKVSFMNAWTNGLRRAFSETMMQSFAKKLGQGWSQLDEWDQFLMGRKGITEADWNIISKATPTERNGAQYLTRDGIVATGEEGAVQAATKWMAFVSDEAQFAVINPDLATRAIVTGGGMPAGTVRGEAARTFMQFKSFPTAMLTRHWARLFDTPQGMQGAPRGFGAQTRGGAAMNRIAVLAGLNVSLMMLGAIVMQTKSMLQGKDPLDMTDKGFWPKALAQGGGMGYVGDLLMKDPTEQRGTNAEQTFGAVLGPTAGAVAGLVGDLGVRNVWEAGQGKDTKFKAEAMRWTNSQLPYANLWQTRALWEHWVIHNAQEAVNPGYLSRMRARAMRDYGQDYYWQPGEALPDRAPNLGAAIGE